MNLAPSILGSTAVAQLKQTAAAALLQIGSDRLTRHDLAGVDCFNFTAARTLGHILQQKFHVKNTRDVYERVPPQALALPGLGVIALAVLGAAFEAKGVGGDEPLENWARKHAPPSPKGQGEPSTTTFATMKKHELNRTRKPAGRSKRR
jgi:hypothetical protein